MAKVNVKKWTNRGSVLLPAVIDRSAFFGTLEFEWIGKSNPLDIFSGNTFVNRLVKVRANELPCKR